MHAHLSCTTHRRPWSKSTYMTVSLLQAPSNAFSLSTEQPACMSADSASHDARRNRRHYVPIRGFSAIYWPATGDRTECGTTLLVSTRGSTKSDAWWPRALTGRRAKASPGGPPPNIWMEYRLNFRRNSHYRFAPDRVMLAMRDNLSLNDRNHTS